MKMNIKHFKLNFQKIISLNLLKEYFIISEVMKEMFVIIMIKILLHYIVIHMIIEIQIQKQLLFKINVEILKK